MKHMKPNMKPAAIVASLTLGVWLMAFTTPAAPAPSSLNIIPTVTNLTLVNGQLLASGTATATIHNRSYTTTFSGVPVNLSVVPGVTNTTGCPVLNLSLGPINLDLLGLVVQTSPICLDITAVPGGGLLGNLLCNVSGLLNQGMTLSQILGLLSTTDANNLISGLTDLVNGVLGIC